MIYVFDLWSTLCLKSGIIHVSLSSPISVPGINSSFDSIFRVYNLPSWFLTLMVNYNSLLSTFAQFVLNLQTLYSWDIPFVLQLNVLYLSLGYFYFKISASIAKSASGIYV